MPKGMGGLPGLTPLPKPPQPPKAQHAPGLGGRHVASPTFSQPMKGFGSPLQASGFPRMGFTRGGEVPALGYAKGGLVIHNFSKGGKTVPGRGNTDTVPAMLTPGEFVIKKKSAQAHKGLIKKINDSDGGPIRGLKGGR